MFKRAHLKDLHCAGHEKDETENQTTKKNRAGPLKMLIHKRFGSCQIKAGLRKPELKQSDCEIRHISESDCRCQSSISSLNNSRTFVLAPLNARCPAAAAMYGLEWDLQCPFSSSAFRSPIPVGLS